MKPTYSESQFAFGVNKELEMGNWRYPLSTPTRIPTQNVESYIGYDTDAEISTDIGIEPIFIQYKRSDHMVGGTARHWSSFPNDYYRFKIKNANQHNTLVETADYFKHTYYVAPRFRTIEEYIQHHQNEELVERSVFATCFGLPAMDENDPSDRHTIGYDDDRTLFFSEPEDIESFSGLSELLSYLSEDEEAFRNIEELRGLFDEVNFSIATKYEGLEVPDRQLQIGNWIRAQQDFFASIGISLSFAFDLNLVYESTISEFKIFEEPSK